MPRSVRIAAFAAALAAAVLCSGGRAGAEPEPGTGGDAETVVLLHGMGRGRASLWVLDTRLRQAGFKTLNFPYVTHSKSLDTLSDSLREFVHENVAPGARYHLVAHSLGNIIIRNGFKRGFPPGLGRIVMLAPPNQPAELARALKDNPIYRWFTGDSGQQLASAEFYAGLPVPEVEFGVIAGDRGQSVTFKEPNDGVVTVDSTRLAGMKDWVLVHHAHTFIMNSRHVALLCAQFLRHGNFVLTEGMELSETADVLLENETETGRDPSENGNAAP